MKSVLISIQPKWCELIANGSKTIEVRKTKPKLETPFKVYIYCTKGDWLTSVNGKIQKPNNVVLDLKTNNEIQELNGKVIGEFVCDEIECFTTDYRANKEQTERISKLSCVSWLEMAEYEINSHCLYGWHISNLVIYDKPRELSEFRKAGFLTEEEWLAALYPNTHCHYEAWAKKFEITRPPQSWCYVESGDTE